MTTETLTLTGLEPLTGTVETGGDYIQFRTNATLDTGAAARRRDRHRGTGRKVMLKSAHPHRAAFGENDWATMLDLTLQRFQPAPA